jgi:hypothetical protein
LLGLQATKQCEITEMKIEMVHVTRRPPWPLWAVLVVFVWLGLGTTIVCLSDYLNRPVQLCLIKRLTGYPCPTCGSTRGVLSLLHGHIVRAWLCNPLLFSVLGLFAAVTAVRVCFARGIKVSLTKNERMLAWILIIVLFFANWAYVIFYVG